MVLLILKIIGWVVLGLILLIIIALFIPADALIHHEHKRFTVTLRYLFFRIKLYDSDKEKETDLPADEEIEVVKKESPAVKTAGTVRLILRLLDPASKSVARILRSLRFRKVCLVLVANGDDAAEIGIHTGRLWAYIGGAMSLVHNLWPHFTCDQLEVLPNFTGEYTGREKFSCQIRAFLFIILLSGLYVLRAFLAARRDLAREETESENDQP